MRKALIAAAAIPVALSLLVPPSASAIDDVNTKKIRKAVTVNGILQHERALQRIANENGGTRASSTPGYDASVKYVARKLRQAGYKVKVQDFSYPAYRELEPGKSSQITPTPTDYETATLEYSGGGDVTGPIIPTKDIVIPPTAVPNGSTSGCEASDFVPAPSGPAIALIQRGTCTLQIKVTNAAAAGYDAVLFFNEGQPGRTEIPPVTVGAPAAIPVNGLTFKDGSSLYALSQAGPVTGRVVAEVEVLIKETANVIADQKKKAKSKDVVVVGAHLDSVPEGPGINDNGSGTAAILEIAEEMSELKYIKKNKLQRQVRFAFWGAEESGLLGSKYYVANLTEKQQAKIYANLNFDMVGSPNYVRFVYDGDGSATAPAGPPGSGAIEKIFTDYFTSRGLASEPTAFDGRSDYGPFIAVGIPAGGLFTGAEVIKTKEQAAIYGGTAGVAYDVCYHQACDTVTNLSTKALYEMGDAAAHAVLTLTKSKEGLFEDASRVAQKSAKVDQLERSGSALVR